MTVPPHNPAAFQQSHWPGAVVRLLPRPAARSCACSQEPRPRDVGHHPVGSVGGYRRGDLCRLSSLGSTKEAAEPLQELQGDGGDNVSATSPIAGPSAARIGPHPAGPDMARFGQMFNSLVANVKKALHGKGSVVQSALTCVLAEGHLLIEDVPGVGKTSLARAICKSFNLTWNRVQFTPDLLAERYHGSHRLRPGDAQRSAFAPARCSPTWSSATRSTGRPRRPSRRCSRSCRTIRCPPMRPCTRSRGRSS